MERFKMTPRFRQSVALILFAVVCFTLINNLTLIVSAFWFLVDLLEPLIIGGILAFFLNVPMCALERLITRLCTRRKRAISPRVATVVALTLTYLGGFLLIILVLYLLIPRFTATIPSVIASVEAALPRFFQFLEERGMDAQRLQSLISAQDLQVLLDTFLSNYQKIISTSVYAVSTVFDVLIMAFSGFAISIYILANKRKLTCQFRKLLYAYVRKRIADNVVNAAKLTNDTFRSFIAGQCVEALVLGVMFLITMSILGLPFAPVISVFIAFTAIIPYVGAFLGGIVGALLIVTVSPMKALIFLITFLVLQQLEEQLIYPRVVGSSVGLSPMWVLVALFVGGKLFGVIGMLFFIPLASVCYSLLRINVDHRLAKRGLSVAEDHIEHVQPISDEDDEDD